MILLRPLIQFVYDGKGLVHGTANEILKIRR